MSRRMVAVAAAVLLFTAAPASAGTPPLIEGRAAVVMDAHSGRLLYELRSDEAAAPASLAKMATAIVVAERLRPTDLVKISKAAAVTPEDSILWPEGHTFTVDVLMHGMIMESSNGAAVALAERVAGSVGPFMGLVNERLRALGATNTNLVNPHGLDAPGQKSTARDLATIARAFANVPWLASVSATLSYPVLRWPPRGETRSFRNRNDFVRSYRGAVGLKNGYTSGAGNAVAAAAVRNEAMLIVVVLNDRKVYADASALMDYGFTLAADLAPAPPPTTQAVAPPAQTVAPTMQAAAPQQAAQPTQQKATQATASASKQQAPAGGGLSFGRLLFLTLGFAYAGRVLQVRSRARRRRKARTAAGHDQAMRPVYIPLEPRAPRTQPRRSGSRPPLRVAGERDVPARRAGRL